MGYLVLALKFRPQKFSEVYAQDHITKILQNTIELDRTAHAYLFTGPRGVGKTSLARIFAKSLNCLTNGPTITPCNTCQNCVEITSGSSTDVLEIDGASNTGVDDIRDLQRELLYSTSNSNYKIYIIDEVHMLSKNAFNALLKTLEEPPDNVIFIFATTEPHKVLPTIISRCQRFDFKRIPIPAIISRLRFICEAEKVQAEDDALFIIAKKADGSLRDALSLMDQVLAYGNKEIKSNDVLSIFGIVHNDVFHAILLGIKNKDATSILKKVHEVMEEGNDIQEFINGLLDYIRNVLLTKIGITVNEVSKDYLKLVMALSKNFTENELLYLMSLLVKAKADIKNSNNPILIAEMSFIKIARLAEMISLEKLVEQISSGKLIATDKPRANPPLETGRSNAVPNSSSAKATPQLSELLKKKKIPAPINDKFVEESAAEKPKYNNITVEILEDNLETIKKKIGKDKLILPTSFSSVSNITINNNIITFFVSDKFNFKRLNSEKTFISDVISTHFNLTINVMFKLLNIEDKKPTLQLSMDNLEKEAPRVYEFINAIGANLTT